MTIKTWLQQFPVIFDRLMRIARLAGRQNALYRAINAYIPKRRTYTFLQIGGNDGITCDPFREFMIRAQARGLTTEPVTEYWNKLKRNYAAYPRVTCLQVAVGYPAKETQFYSYTKAYMSKRGDWWELTGLAGFSRAKLEQSLLPGDDPAECIAETLVPTLTVEDVLKTSGFEAFDCLFLDCEGHEENVLNNLDYAIIKPKMLVYEHTHFPGSAQTLSDMLRAKGFITQQLEHDTVAIHDDWKR